MSGFDIANWLAFIVGFIVLIASLRRLGRTDLLLVWVLITTMITLSFWVSPSVLMNLTLLLLSLYFMPKLLAGMKEYAIKPLNWVGIGFLVALFLIPIVLNSADGWLIVLRTAIRYWFLVSVALLYSISRNNRLRSTIVVATLSAALLWQFKLASIVFLVMLLDYIVGCRSMKRLLRMSVVVVLVAAVAYFSIYEEIVLFLENSVFRPNYAYDTKIFGFSDGMRLIIWNDYIENAIWLGKGTFSLPYTVATHNIFVHLAHELGILGLIVIGPIFAFLLVRLVFVVGIVLAVTVVLALNLSSVGEYPSMWIFCFVIAPAFLNSSLVRRRIALRSQRQDSSHEVCMSKGVVQ